jgi:hypothetical protein
MEDQSKDSDWEMQVGLMLLTLLGYMGSFEKLARVWREEMTPERKARIPSALFLRVGDALSFDDFDCSKLGGFWGYWLTHSRDVAKWITEETHSLTGVPLANRTSGVHGLGGNVLFGRPVFPPIFGVARCILTPYRRAE